MKATTEIALVATGGGTGSTLCHLCPARVFTPQSWCSRGLSTYTITRVRPCAAPIAFSLSAPREHVFAAAVPAAPALAIKDTPAGVEHYFPAVGSKPVQTWHPVMAYKI